MVFILINLLFMKSYKSHSLFYNFNVISYIILYLMKINQILIIKIKFLALKLVYLTAA